MAGANVIWETGKATVTYTQGAVPATELRLKWGTVTGAYPNVKVLPIAASQEVPYVGWLEGPGQYYAVVTAANAVGEGPKSAERPFVAASGLPDGLVDLSIG